MTFNARISVPKSAAAGEVVEIKTLVSHPMESGFRRDTRGALIPRDIITRFTCKLDGHIVFAANFGPGVAANPYLSFRYRAETTGTLEFRWVEQNGTEHVEQRTLQVALG